MPQRRQGSFAFATGYYRTTTHAVTILLDRVEAANDFASTRQIVDRVGLSQQNAFKIVSLLVKDGLLTSMLGRGGGVLLARSAAEITLDDVARAVEVNMLAKRAKSKWQTGDHQVFDKAREAFFNTLAQHTLADLAKLSGLTPRNTQASKAASTVRAAAHSGESFSKGSRDAVLPTKRRGR